MKKIFVFLFAVMSLLNLACKKSTKTSTSTPNTDFSMQKVPTTGSREELTADSVLLYAQQVYYWNSTLPTYETFNPRQYVGDVTAELSAIGKYSPNSTLYPAKKLDKYSFADKGEVGEILSGTNPGDYGFGIFYPSASDLRIKMVYAGSPADNLGITRGDRILAINDRNDIQIVGDAAPDFVIDAIFNTAHSSVKLKIQKADGTQQDLTINRAAFSINPILYTHVYTLANGRKAGYIVYNSFTTNSSAGIQTAINNFATQNCTDLIIDLRYNGGGSIATSNYFANLLVPSSKNNTPANVEIYNPTMQNGQAYLLKNQYFQYNNTTYNYFNFSYKEADNKTLFSKIGSFSPAHLYFLVTGGTASASELLINSLRPHIDTKLIGKLTYGKPIGFFPMKIANYDVYYAMIETKNGLNQGGYFDGMAVDKNVTDDLSHNWGDTNESLLNEALYHIQNGSFSTVARKASADNSLSEQTIQNLNQKLKSSRELNEMFYQKIK